MWWVAHDPRRFAYVDKNPPEPLVRRQRILVATLLTLVVVGVVIAIVSTPGDTSPTGEAGPSTAPVNTTVPLAEQYVFSASCTTVDGGVYDFPTIEDVWASGTEYAECDASVASGSDYSPAQLRALEIREEQRSDTPEVAWLGIMYSICADVGHTYGNPEAGDTLGLANAQEAKAALRLCPDAPHSSGLSRASIPANVPAGDQDSQNESNYKSGESNSSAGLSDQERFLLVARNSEPSLSSVSDASLLSAGQAVCDDLDAGTSVTAVMSNALAGMRLGGGGADSETWAATIVASAVYEMCPSYVSDLTSAF